MKKLIKAGIMLLILSSALYSQTNYFAPSSAYTIYCPNYSYNEFYGLKFDLSEIGSSGRLDLSGIFTSSNYNYNSRLLKGWYNINNGNEQFSNPYEFYSGISFNTDSLLSDILFVKLRDGNYPKDVVMVKKNTIQINQNINNAISSTPYWYVEGGNGKYLSSGHFSYSVYYREDVVVIADNNKIKIYVNDGDGKLFENNSYYLNIDADKVLLKQFTDLNRIEIQTNLEDRDELIVQNENNIKIYKNKNNNGFYFDTPFAELSLSETLFDFGVADMNRDGYNDLIVLSGNSYSQTLKVYLNAQG